MGSAATGTSRRRGVLRDAPRHARPAADPAAAGDPAGRHAAGPAAGARRAGAGLLLAVAVWAAVTAAAGIPARATYGAQTSADEPQYLLTALSIARDGDLDIGDELAAREWLAFHEAVLPRQTRLLPDGRRVSPHDPLLPLLLAPAMGLGGWVAAKATLALLAGGLAALLVWTATARLGVRPRTAAAVVAVFAASLPLAPYGSQVYPEVPAALAVTAAVALLTGPRLGRAALWGLGACVVALPWLALKHAPVGAALAAVAVARLWRARRHGAAAGLLLGLAAAGAVFVVVHLLVWTGLTPYASGDHFVDRGEFSAVGFAPNPAGRAVRLSGLLVGARFGIAAWQPAWLLAVPAVGAVLGSRTRWRGVLLAPLVVGWLVATFVALTMQGWWVPGRQVVVVLPLAVLALAWWADRHTAVLAATLALGAVGVLAHLWLAVEASVGRVVWIVDFYDTAYPVYRLWWLALPDYLAPSAGTWPVHAAWTAVLAAALLAAAWHSRRTLAHLT